MSQKLFYSLTERLFPKKFRIKHSTYTEFFITVVSIRENENNLIFPKREITKLRQLGVCSHYVRMGWLRKSNFYDYSKRKQRSIGLYIYWLLSTSGQRLEEEMSEEEVCFAGWESVFFLPRSLLWQHYNCSSQKVWIEAPICKME